jgi:7,8-dihydropterin-6-yl-methyl-4-(beta-D-ribofuranosyl)aminobenzene 5'-phosphate synthase
MTAIQEVKVVVLTDSSVNYKDILGEGGFAAIVDVTYDDESKFRILFDTGGSTPALKHNLEVLEEDLSSINAIVLSHGHWDHIGGLMDTLVMVGKKIPVICHPDVLVPKTFIAKDGKRIPIGLQDYFTTTELESKAELVITTESHELAPGILTTGEVPRNNDFEKLAGNLLDIVTIRGEKESRDLIRDDLSLIFQLADGSVVVLAGCCHSGISNTISHVVDLTGTKSIIGIVGGFHLHDASRDRLEKTVEYLGDFPLTTVAPCHCTGLRGRAALMYAFEEPFRDIGAGDELKFTST